MTTYLPASKRLAVLLAVLLALSQTEKEKDRG